MLSFEEPPVQSLGACRKRALQVCACRHCCRDEGFGVLQLYAAHLYLTLLMRRTYTVRSLCRPLCKGNHWDYLLHVAALVVHRSLAIMTVCGGHCLVSPQHVTTVASRTESMSSGIFPISSAPLGPASLSCNTATTKFRGCPSIHGRCLVSQDA